MPYEIKELKLDKRQLLIPQKLAHSLGIKLACASEVRFGTRCITALIRPSRRVTDGLIYVSSSLKQALGLPTAIRCQIAQTGKGLNIGPYIGVLVSKRQDRLFRRRLKSLLPDARAVTEQGGMVMAFALEHVNRSATTISGFFYQPESGDWQAVDSPYPAAIYRRIGVSPGWRGHFLAATGQRMFNSYFWDKWELHRWVQHDSTLALHLPETTVYSSWREVLAFVERFGAAFIKPAAGMRGAATLLVQQEAGQLLLRYNDGACQVMNQEQAVEEIIRHCGNRRYLVQRYIPLLNWRRGVVDFRVLMQKDDSLRWSCQGIIARVGSPGNIVSNISRQGRAFSLSQFVELVRPEFGQQVDRWEDQLIQAADAICNLLDRQGLILGTLGLDIGIDRTGHWWLIEANNRDPDPTIAVDADWPELHSKLRLNPLLCAKGLAGFTRR